MQAFGDGFDLYATNPDAGVYWDSSASAGQWSVQPGRFTGSQALRGSSSNLTYAAKASGSNDAIHHVNFAFRETNNLAAGSGITVGFQFLDGATAQCTAIFRQDGALELRSGGATGTVLATWPTAYYAAGVWHAYELEVVIHNTAGSITVRRNGNPTADFTATGLNTRGGTANNYASRMAIVSGGNVTGTEYLDDVLWRSDASSVPWIGDVRCYTRMPASDASVQFAKSPTVLTMPGSGASSISIVTGTPRYVSFTATATGTIGSVTMQLAATNTGNMKCSIFASNGTAPTTVLGSATPLAAPAAGVNTFTFGTPVSVTLGTQYWIGFASDTSAGQFTVNNALTTGATSATTYAAFPAANPTITPAQNPVNTSQIITVTANVSLVSEAQQDGTATYVYDSTVGHADLYNIAASATPAASGTIVAVTTRGMLSKSDAGTRGAAMQLKSGATTVQSTAAALPIGFAYQYRTDMLNPNGSIAWTPAAVDAVQIGPVVTS